jgi:Golgi phosphoprotein 3
MLPVSRRTHAKVTFRRRPANPQTAYASSVLENALQRLSYDSREAAFVRCDEILAEFSTWPFGIGTSSQAGPVTVGGGSKRRDGGSGIGRESVQELVREVRKEMAATSNGTAGSGGGSEDQEDLCFEVVATVLEIFGRMDSLVSSYGNAEDDEGIPTWR